jgi:glucoamylase
MPLVWAHAEYLKLRRSIADGRVFDTPRQTWDRYVVNRTDARHAIWRFNHRCRTMTQGRVLRIGALAAFLVHWSADEWRTTTDTTARDSGLGMFAADLPTESLPAGTNIVFTFYWPGGDRWEGTDFVVEIVPAAS